MGRRKCILIVDDDDSVCFVLYTALQKLAHICQVHVASSGEEALERLRESPFDLIITDLLMPGMKGQELTAAIRQKSPETVVIWITAHRSPQTDEEARELAVYRCLDKPVSVAQIRDIVPKALGVATRPGWMVSTN
jgi:CheY-like chemotaxis protein